MRKCSRHSGEVPASCPCPCSSSSSSSNLVRDADLRLLEVRRVLDVFGVVRVEALGTESAATREVVGAKLRLAELLTDVHNSRPSLGRVSHVVTALCLLSLEPK